MAPNKRTRKKKECNGTKRAREMDPKASTDIFKFYQDDLKASHERVMAEFDASLLKILTAQSPKSSDGRDRFKRPNGKLYTPEGDGTFQIWILPSEDSPEEEALRLLYRWVDFYYLGFGVEDTWYLFQDDDDKVVVPVPPVPGGGKGLLKELPFGRSYAELGGMCVTVGPNAIFTLYRALMAIESNLRKYAAFAKDAWSSLEDCQMALPAVIFPEAFRFLKLRAWLSATLGAGGETPIPDSYTDAFTSWSSDSQPLFTENPRPHQKYYAHLAVLNREAHTVVPYYDPQHMPKGFKESDSIKKFYGKEKVRLNVVVIGHLQSGKSTTFGHLIYLMGGIAKDAVQEYEKKSAGINNGSRKYAWVLDKLKAERERGISIDIALWNLESKKYAWTIIDAPGHRDFIKNMIAGLSQADCCVMLIDATNFQAGIQGQTREHGLIAFALGVRQMICCINKMDATNPKYSKAIFEQIQKEVRSCIGNVGFKNALFVPISGLEGDCIMEKSAKLAWYDGPTLLEAMDMMSVPKLPKEQKRKGQPPKELLPLDKRPLRLPLRHVYKIGGLGTVSVGRVQTGGLPDKISEVTFSPNGLKGDLMSVELHHESVQLALPGDSVGVHTRRVAVKDLKRGYVLSNPEKDPAKEAISFRAILKVLRQVGDNQPGEKPLEIHCGYTPVMHCHTSQVAVKFVKLESKVWQQLDRIG